MPEEPSSENGKRQSTGRTAGRPALAEVTLLDGKILEVRVERKAKGENIFDEVCEHLDLHEKDYFGLNYLDKVGRRTWLDLDKRVGKVLKGEPWKLDFEVKFYPKDPSQLQEDFTRYLLCLQVRNDILCGKLPCSFVTHAMLGSYLVQSQLGDYSAEEYPDASYLAGFKFSPNPEPGLDEKVMELHKGHKGQTPAEAEQHYLENAKKLSLYGVDMHPAKDSEGVDIQIGVCSTGILIYQEMLRINRFAWPKILKISYRRNNFYIKIRPGEFEQYEQTVGFKLDNSRAAKNLWKVCVDQHTFFRLMSADATKRPVLTFPRFQSLYRWNRKTQAEVLDSTNPQNNQNFTRSHSCRPSRSLDALGQQIEPIDDAQKRHTMSYAPARPQNFSSPTKVEKGEESSAASVSSVEGEFSTYKNDEKKLPGGVAVLPKEPFKKKKSEKDSSTNGLSVNELDDEEKENRSNRIETLTTPMKDEAGDKKKQNEKSPGLIGIFSSPKDKKNKDKDAKEKELKDKSKKKEKPSKKEKIAVAETVTGETVIGDEKTIKNDFGKDDKKAKDEGSKSKKDKLSVFKSDKKDKAKKSKLDSSKSDDSKNIDSSLDRSKTPEKDRSIDESSSSPYTKVYEYTAEEESNRPRTVSGFSYESDKTSPVKHSERSPTSPVRTERATAFNYAPGDIKKVDGDDSGTGKKLFSFFSRKKDDSPKGKDDSEKQKKDSLKHSSKDNVSSPNEKSNKAEGTPKADSDKKNKDDKKTKDDKKSKDKDESKTKVDLKSIDKDDKKSKEKDDKKSKEKDDKKSKDKDDKKSKDKDDKKSKEKDDKKSKDKDDKKSKDKDEKSKDKDDKKSKDKDDKKSKDKDDKKSKDKDDSLTKDDKKSKDGSKILGILSKDAKSNDELTKDVSKANDKTKGDSKTTEDLLMADAKPDGKSLSADFIRAETDETKFGPKIVKTTTKSQIFNSGGTLTQNVEESIEDVNTGEITLSTHVNTAEGLDESRSPYITATAVTTRTATTLEDLGTNAKTSQVEEKTVARSTTTTGLRQEQRVVTQEVRATTVVNDPQLKRSGSTSSLSSDDSGTPIDGESGTYYTDKPQDPIVKTETVLYSPISEEEDPSAPLIQAVASQRLEDGTFDLPGAVMTSQTITSKTRTVETLTYKTEKDGVVETRVEQKITIQSDGDPIDHEKALNEAIQEATAMNPDMRVEKIEIQQESVP